MVNSERNGKIEWLRFAGSVAIALFHFEWLYITHPVFLNQGYLFVEFFFILSGYFLARQQSDPKTAKDPLTHVCSQAAKLYPLYLCAVILSFVERGIWEKWTPTAVLGHLWKAKWELMFLSDTGLSGDEFYLGGGAPDYISAMLIASVVLCWLIRYHKEVFAGLLGPSMALLGYTYLLGTAGNLSQWRTFNGVICLGVVRAFAGMSAGAWSSLVLQPIIQAHHRGNASKCLICLLVIGWIVFGRGIEPSDTVLCVPAFSAILAILDTGSCSTDTKTLE